MVYNWFAQKVSTAKGEYLTYGIEAKTGFESKTVKDVTTEKAKIIALVNVFNEEGLSIVHLEQAIEDFLYDLTI